MSRHTSTSSNSDDHDMDAGDQPESQNNPEPKNPVVILPTDVSALNKCQLSEAAELCIYNIYLNSRHSGNYDIGGVYTGEKPEMWFYYLTRRFSGLKVLISLFVYHRSIGNFTIKIGKYCNLVQSLSRQAKAYTLSTSEFTHHTFLSLQPDQHYYIKTFCISRDDLEALKDSSVFTIPIQIDTTSKCSLDLDISNQIKLNHTCSFGSLLHNRNNTDFELISKTGEKHSTHKMFLCAHSAVLRAKINDASESSESSFHVDAPNQTIEILLEYLYTGTINNIKKYNLIDLKRVVEQLEITQLGKYIATFKC